MTQLQDNDLTAYYTAPTSKSPAGLSIYRHFNGRNRLVTAMAVDGRADAKARATSLNAKPMNF